MSEAKPADATLLGLPLQWFGLLGIVYYFAYFLVLLPFVLPKLEKVPELPVSIADAYSEKSSGKQKAAKEQNPTEEGHAE